jgi:type II restriction enzyme
MRSLRRLPYELSHAQVQTLLASIGHAKGYDVFVPPRDLILLDWDLARRFTLRRDVPQGFGEAERVLREIDVIWIAPGMNNIQGLFEVEHSTTIYSGLLRFNDVLLTSPRLSRFVIVSNDSRRGVYARQVFRPTFRRSGLAELASFLDYVNVFDWHRRSTMRAMKDEPEHA